jgi:hypothetical protein
MRACAVGLVASFMDAPGEGRVLKSDVLLVRAPGGDR